LDLELNRLIRIKY